MNKFAQWYGIDRKAHPSCLKKYFPSINYMAAILYGQPIRTQTYILPAMKKGCLQSLKSIPLKLRKKFPLPKTDIRTCLCRGDSKM